MFLPFRDSSFDAIVMSQVLEHMWEPETLLKEVSRVLSDGGSVLVLVPNVNSLQRRWFGESWINWHLPFHLSHFDANTLKRLLGRAEFNVEKCVSMSPGDWALLTVTMKFKGLSFLNKYRLVRVMARLIAVPALRLMDALGEGDCLLVQARKAVVHQGSPRLSKILEP
jgi:SAM-dependent methyltransferase